MQRVQCVQVCSARPRNGQPSLQASRKELSDCRKHPLERARSRRRAPTKRRNCCLRRRRRLGPDERADADAEWARPPDGESAQHRTRTDIIPAL